MGRLAADSYTKFAIQLFGSFVEEHVELFPSIADDLRKANIRQTVDEYVSTSALTSLVSPFLTFPLAFVVCIALGFDLFITFFITLLTGFITFILIVSLFYFYPSLKAESMKKSIENSLPFASIYLSTLAGTGMPVGAIFRILADFPEYGEVSKQAQYIVNDTELLGMDIATSLGHAAKRTPSEEFQSLLLGMRSTILSGGDLKKFLIEKSKSYMALYRRNIDMYVEQLSLFTELYITAVVVGSIFFIVMTTIMNMMGAGGTIVLLQALVVYIFLPLVSIAFMILISMMAPG